MHEHLSKDLASLKIERDVNPDAKSPWRAVAMGGGALVALALVVSGLLGSLKDRFVSRRVEVTQVRLISPAQGSVQVTSTGYVVAQTTSKVGAKVLGRVSEVLVQQGSVVKAGDVLLKLETAEQRASLAQARARHAAAKARIETARATLADTRRQYAREKALFEQGATARSVVEDLESRAFSLAEGLKAAEADALAEEASAAALDATLSYATIRAPIDGTVLGKPVEVGELVGPQTPPVVELANFATLMVETDVPEGRLHLVRAGSPAEIVLDAYPTKRHRGEVAELSPRVNRAKATLIVKVKFVDETEGVLPDMAARVSFLSEPLDAESMKKPPVLLVPGSAVTERNGQKVVFRIEEGRARLTPVKLGEPVGSGFALLSGPSDGARVVAHPDPSLLDGESIQEKSP
jgi:RND family efflux transporter MFP subunit